VGSALALPYRRLRHASPSALVNSLSGIHQHGIVAIKRWPGLFERDASPTTGQELPSNLWGDLIVAMAEKKVQQGFSLVFGNYNGKVTSAFPSFLSPFPNQNR
jgi:hypothetical protein